MQNSSEAILGKEKSKNQFGDHSEVLEKARERFFLLKLAQCNSVDRVCIIQSILQLESTLLSRRVRPQGDVMRAQLKEKIILSEYVSW